MRVLNGFVAVLLVTVAPAVAGGLDAPVLHVPTGGDTPRVALTLDACGGATDRRILDFLVSERIPATIFATARWIRRNPAAIDVLKANRDLFAIENHGANHVPAVLGATKVFGLKPAGSEAAVKAEVEGGAETISSIAPRPVWYRGATALYSPAAEAEIGKLGFRIAGFSLNADHGASLIAGTVARRVSAAKDGDVIIAHVNQPGKSSGAGLVEGLKQLKAKGYRFVTLDGAH